MTSKSTSRVLGAIDRRRWVLRLAIGSVAAAVPCLFTANPVITAVAVLVPACLFSLLWRPGEPSVLLFAATFQWLQVFAPILNANRWGEAIDQYVPDMRTAAWLGLVTVVILSIGMRLGAGRKSIVEPAVVERAAAALSPVRLGRAYVVMFVFASVNGRLSVLPGMRQQLIALATLRWVIVFLIGWAALRDRRFRTIAAMVLFVEILTGFTGYFSSFKTILFVVVVLITASAVTIRRILRPSLVAAILAVIALSAFWQAVKNDYREFLNGGRRAQIAVVPVLDRFAYLGDRISNITFDDLAAGADSGLERVGYIEYFAQSIRNVPGRVPYQGGRLWREALVHVVTPRVFFPNKPVINDSDRTNEFSGVHVATADEGASISLGYAAESYIDFGPLFMFVPIFLLGCFWGCAYRWLAARTRHPLLGIAVSTNLILGHAIYFESSNIKLFGGAMSSLIVLAVVLHFFGDRIWRHLAPVAVRRRVAAAPAAAPSPQPIEHPFALEE